jgi:ABC-type Zn uptake system ZnuABC Zn-binding protein ZnuA
MFFRLNKKDVLIFMVVFVLLGTIFALRKSPSPESGEYSIIENSSLPKVYVAASFPLVLDWAKAVGQDRVSTELFVSPSDGALNNWLKAASDSDQGFPYRIFFSAGGGFDDWAIDLSRRSAKIKVILLNQFASSTSVTYLNILDSKKSIKADNSYYWLSLENGHKAVQEIARVLGQLDVGNKEYYINNAYKYSIQLDTLLQESLDTLRHFKNERIVVNKGLFSPLVESLQLHVAGAFDISDGQYDSDKIATVLRSALRKNGVKTVIADMNFKNSSLGQSLTDSSFRIVGLDPWGINSDNYISFMRDTISQIIRSL